MQPERGWLIGPGDTVLHIDEAGVVTFNGTALDEAALLEATPIDGDVNGRCEVRPVAHAQFLLGADATQFTPSGDVCRQYYATTNPRGWYESWAFGQWPFGLVTAAVLYAEQGADHGRQWMAAGLTWVKQ